MHPISDFSNIFALSAGVHIVYGLLRDIHNLPLALINRLVSTCKHIEKWTVGNQDKGLMTSTIMRMELTRDRHEAAMRPYIRVFVSLAAVVVFYSTGWLVLLSFDPQYQVSTLWMGLWTSLALLPMPLLAAITFALSHRAIAQVRALEREFVNILQKNLTTPS